MRENKSCKNWDECSGIAEQNRIQFSCDSCDGTVLARNAGTTNFKGPSSDQEKIPKKQPELSKICSGILCKQKSPNGVVLPLSHFGKNRAAPDGLQWNCKKCVCESVRITKLNRKTKSVVKVIGPVKTMVDTPDLLYEKLITRLDYHKAEVKKIEGVLETIMEIMGKEARYDK